MRQVDVLLIDDNQADIKLTLHVMNEENPPRRVHVIRDGEEAMSFILGQRQDAAEHKPTLGLVLLDLKLPKVNGFEILQSLRQQSLEKTNAVPTLLRAWAMARIYRCGWRRLFKCFGLPALH
jgi:two-component system, chemotaxis family, response regulator Rcp1